MKGVSVVAMVGLGVFVACSFALGQTRPAKELTLDLGNGVSMKLVRIPAGKFMMGSPEAEKERLPNEGPQREVTFAKAFYMGAAEVTQEQYEQVMGVHASTFKGPKNPVEQVSWDDAVEFCGKLSAKTGKTVRLPTEDQWEYACRAGTTTPFHTGETISTDQANYQGDHVYGAGTKGANRARTTPVASFPPNAWGLYDMHGNVAEWCSDWSADPYGQTEGRDPHGAGPGGYHIVRGGAWIHYPTFCRSAYRTWSSPQHRYPIVGIRVVIDDADVATAATAPKPALSPSSPGAKALRDAVSHNDATAIKAWAAKGRNPDIIHLDGGTMLHAAAMMGYRDSVAALLEAGASPRIVRKDGQTPLHFAAKYKAPAQLEIVSLLIRAGADPDARDAEGKTAYDYATADGNQACADLLRKVTAHAANQVRPPDGPRK